MFSKSFYNGCACIYTLSPSTFAILCLTEIIVFIYAVAVPAPEGNHDKKGMNVALVILLVVLVSAILILAMMGAYKYWQKKKREQDQARFLKLFEEGDDLEDELGLGTII